MWEKGAGSGSRWYLRGLGRLLSSSLCFVHQLSGVGVLSLTKPPCREPLHNASLEHHSSVVADLADYRKVMRDQQQAKPLLPLKPP